MATLTAETKTCELEECGKSFNATARPQGGGMPQRACSKSCAQKLRRRKQKKINERVSSASHEAAL